MILTFKIKHGRDFSKELILARKVAEFAVKTGTWSSREVKHIGLKSVISCQILRKYSRNKTLKEIRNVKLTVPGQSVKTNKKTLTITCLKLSLPIFFDKSFTKINQVEIGAEYAYVSVTYKDPKLFKPKTVIGVDRNTTHHVLVASNLNTGKVLKLGKKCLHIHNKYKHIRKHLQRQGKFRLIKQIKTRESRIVKDINHKISRRLVEQAKKDKAIIVLEDIKEIRQTAKTRRKQRYSLHSWSFYQLGQMIGYKAKKFGVSVAYVEPQYTSQRCSRCGHIEANNRKGNLFHCVKCGTVEDSGANAGFNIAYLHQARIPRFEKDSDFSKARTDTARGEMR